MTKKYGDDDIAGHTRRGMRDKFKDGKLIEQMVHDLKYLLDVEDAPEAETLFLWDDREGLQKFGVQYHDFAEVR